MPLWIEPKTVLVPAGWFLMGSDHGEPCEAPIRRVWTDEFRLAVTPTTNREYGLFFAASGRQPPPFWNDPAFSKPDQPVVGTNWFDAAAYCAWLSEMTGKAFRLPTEAERERAARGGREGLEFPWGNDLPPDWRGGRGAPLEPVGSREPNGYGLHDMANGVHEWCSDWHGGGGCAVSPERNPAGPASGTRRAARGGSWRHRVRFTRCAARSSLAPEKRFSDFGFRCALNGAE